MRLHLVHNVPSSKLLHEFLELLQGVALFLPHCQEILSGASQVLFQVFEIEELSKVDFERSTHGEQGPVLAM